MRSASFIVASELKLILWSTFPHCFSCKVAQKRSIYHLVINSDSSQYGLIAKGKRNPFEHFRNPIGQEGGVTERIYRLERISISIPVRVPALKNLIEYKLFYRAV
jgi:hypothetical protein